ncbi:MAG TPA: hypothetical protein VHR35_06135 [Nocardioides sp.]|jgi:hypothetical protein|nr:hypothetical protein [Nocardioides sp.]
MVLQRILPVELRHDLAVVAQPTISPEPGARHRSPMSMALRAARV